MSAITTSVLLAIGSVTLLIWGMATVSSAGPAWHLVTVGGLVQ